MVRTCPSCKSKLDASSSYFCSFCGQKLPEELKSSPKSVRNTRVFLSKKKPSDIISVFTDFRFKKTLIGLGLVFIAVFAAFVFFKNFRSSDEDKTTQQLSSGKGKISYKNTKEGDLDMITANFNQYDARNYTPYDVDFYFEFSDFSKFSDYFGFLGSNYFTLSENLSGKVSSFFSVFVSIGEEGYIWNFIFFPAEGYGGVSGEYEDLYIESVEGAIVVSTSESVINSVRSAKTGISKNLSLHPSYVSIKNNLPPEGKVFMISLTDKGKNYVLGLKNSDVPTKFSNLIQSLEDIRSNYLVIF
ncbi:hypothetical protein ACFLZ4_00120 [Patescibacteria group bacterium]